MAYAAKGYNYAMRNHRKSMLYPCSLVLDWHHICIVLKTTKCHPVVIYS